MGSQCTTLRKRKVESREEDHKSAARKPESPATGGGEEKGPDPQAGPSVTTGERRREEQGYFSRGEDGRKKEAKEEKPSEERGKKKNAVSACRHSDSSPCHEEADTVMEEACWVDNNRPNLIQSMTLVMPIADELLKRKMIHREFYSNIKTAGTSQDQMRKLYEALNAGGDQVKSAFYRLLQKNKPDICEMDKVIRRMIKQHKAHLREEFRFMFEGTADNAQEKELLDHIYTELHIIQGESEQVNEEHEIWDIEAKSRTQPSDSTKIDCNDIFKTETGNKVLHGQDSTYEKTVKTVMTKGIAGIGKTVSVRKFILDWAEERTNQDFDFIFMLSFRGINLIKNDQFSLQTLVKYFYQNLKDITVQILADHKVLFIFDGLDESQLELDFSETKMLNEVTREASVDVLLTNLIRRDLLPSAFLWITSRPGAASRIPRRLIDQWTEVQGFSDSQKEEYFRRRIKDENIAERIISHIKMSRSFYIMCHIPIFCWISAQVLQHLCKSGKTKVESDVMKIPTTLTEMYTHFLLIQIKLSDEKYDNSRNESEIQKILSPSKDFILKLGRMAFEHLERSSILFYEDDLTNYGIDIRKVGVNCGLCTEILKEECVFYKKKVYCFVHLTIQEYFAALFVYHSYAVKKIDSPSLRTFLTKGSEETLESILDEEPIKLTLDEFCEISIANATDRKTGGMDMFIRFLIGLSLESTQRLLQGLLEQTEKHSEVVEEIKSTLKEIDVYDRSPERCLNLVHCFMELKDSSLHDDIRECLLSNHKKALSPLLCSALADTILMSVEPIDELDLRKYRSTLRGVFRLLPAVRNCKKAIISGVWLNDWFTETIASALRQPNSSLTELHLTNNVFLDQSITFLTDGLMNPHCKLEALSLSGEGLSKELCETLAEAVLSIISRLRELELSSKLLGSGLQPVLHAALRSPKLEKLRLRHNVIPAQICQELQSVLTSDAYSLMELDLSYAELNDSKMESLSVGLMSTTCRLEVLRLRFNDLSEDSCKMLALVFSSAPSHLRELDLSHNQLRDSGVKLLCTGMMSPHCKLNALRLSFCKVTEVGCGELASVLKSKRCTLMDLDLSFNHPGHHGEKLLTERLQDASCSLQKLKCL
ncbi:NACHT, LRR and PYD domains-containing protein 12-like isoform X2 [Lampris incognitus]|uniref:NACHT, LRR and PYD domains-containing protein 12-like isoform X2 n=1 Tax=Lampris incognitus TaxID=2546036 RepID=UPI0024B55DC3|nr:NACHT, LRR and PYD domains-containing protein 12-like isoform X2 [Lampris incognitus]